MDSLAQVNWVRADSIGKATEIRIEEMRDKLAPSLQALREGLLEFRDSISPAMEQMVREIEATADSLRPALREFEQRVSGVASSFAINRQRQQQHVYFPDRGQQYPNDETREAVDFLKQELITLLAEYGHTLRELQDDDIILLNFSLRGGATGFAGRDVPLKLSVKTSDLRSYTSGRISRDQLTERFTLL